MRFRYLFRRGEISDAASCAAFERPKVSDARSNRRRQVLYRKQPASALPRLFPELDGKRIAAAHKADFSNPVRDCYAHHIEVGRSRIIVNLGPLGAGHRVGESDAWLGCESQDRGSRSGGRVPGAVRNRCGRRRPRRPRGPDEGANDSEEKTPTGDEHIPPEILSISFVLFHIPGG